MLCLLHSSHSQTTSTGFKTEAEKKDKDQNNVPGTETMTKATTNVFVPSNTENIQRETSNVQQQHQAQDGSVPSPASSDRETNSGHSQSDSDKENIANANEEEEEMLKKRTKGDQTGTRTGRDREDQCQTQESASASGWRRLLVNVGSEQEDPDWQVRFVSPEGKRFGSNEDLQKHLKEKGIDPASLHFLSQEFKCRDKRRRWPIITVAFCNMRQNILDMRRKKGRRKSKDLGRRNSAEVRKNSDASENAANKKEEIPSQITTHGNHTALLPSISEEAEPESTQKDEPMEVSGEEAPSQQTAQKQLKSHDVTEVANNCSRPDDDKPPIPVTHEEMEEDDPVACQLSATDQITRPVRDELVPTPVMNEKGHNKQPSTPPPPQSHINHSIPTPTFETATPPSPIHDDPLAISRPASADVLESPQEVFPPPPNVRRYSMEPLVDYSMSENDSDEDEEEDDDDDNGGCEDEIAATCGFDDEDDVSPSTNFLSCFLEKFQQDEAGYNCRIPIVDIFGKSPLGSFICYGCSQPYSSRNVFTVDFKCQTISIVCSHCSWWTSRRIEARQFQLNTEKRKALP